MTHADPQILVPTLGVDTRAWQYGPTDGVPLIMVHGFRGDHHGLDAIAQRIAETTPGIRTIVPDLPGFGATPAIANREHSLELYAEWLQSFVDALTGESLPVRFHILGHSFGSLVVAAALSHELDPLSITLINPISTPALHGRNAIMTKLAVAYYRAADALPEKAARQLLGNPLIVRAMSEVMATTRDPQLRNWIHNQHAQYFSHFSDSGTLLQAFRASVTHTVSDFIEGFGRPTLIIAGDRDDIAPLTGQLKLQRQIPGATLKIVPGVGHLVHYEAVEDAAAFAGGFCTSFATHSDADATAL